MVKGGMSLPEAASQSLAVLSLLAVRILVPSGLNTPRDLILMVKGCEELARGRIPELGGVVLLAVRIRAPSGLNAASSTSS